MITWWLGFIWHFCFDNFNIWLHNFAIAKISFEPHWVPVVKIVSSIVLIFLILTLFKTKKTITLKLAYYRVPGLRYPILVALMESIFATLKTESGMAFTSSSSLYKMWYTLTNCWWGIGTPLQETSTKCWHLKSALSLILKSYGSKKNRLIIIL